MNISIQKITPFLWFDNQAEEAMNLYTRYVHTHTHDWLTTLNSILLIQNTCLANNWDFRFTTFRRYVDEWRSICPNGLLNIQSLIDWDKFVYYDGVDGGLLEYTNHHNLGFDDYPDGHPTPAAHKHFVKNFWLPTFKNFY